MNTFNFDQTGGFPFETDTLSELVKAFSIFNALGFLAGDKTIIHGADSVSTGQIYDPGFVIINGELLPFIGGDTLPNVKIYQNVTEKIFEDGASRPVFFDRYVGFGVGDDSFPFSDFTYLRDLKVVQKQVVPYGLIALWPTDDLENIPDGWSIVNDVVAADQRESFTHIKFTG